MKKKSGPFQRRGNIDYRLESETVLSALESRAWSRSGPGGATSGVTSIARYFNFAAREVTEVYADSSYKINGAAPGAADVKSDITRRSFAEMNKDEFSRYTLQRATRIFAGMGGKI